MVTLTLAYSRPKTASAYAIARASRTVGHQQQPNNVLRNRWTTRLAVSHHFGAHLALVIMHGSPHVGSALYIATLVLHRGFRRFSTFLLPLVSGCVPRRDHCHRFVQRLDDGPGTQPASCPAVVEPCTTPLYSRSTISVLLKSTDVCPLSGFQTVRMYQTAHVRRSPSEVMS